MDRRIPNIAVLLALCLLPLAACTETPETELSWGVNDHIAAHRSTTVKSASAQTPRVYVYQDPDEAMESPPVPTPRPSYNQPTRAAAAERGAPVYEYKEPYRAASSTPAGGSVAFAWPVNGQVISGFGTARNGTRNDGINIAARLDTPIRAAASGTVSYADTLSGYGKLVLIKHSNGYVTAYAHADRLLVAQGDFVVKGQVIGYAGQTGDVTSPQLHFEIRSGTTPVDPQRYLTARAGA
jgi:murein DD-endopeptidase MepM/ murein hydrolase activator NlpD